jgi:hypothetical protein
MQKGAPQRIPIEWVQGTTLGAPGLAFIVAWLQANGNPVTLTGYTATLIASASAFEDAVYSASTTPTSQGAITIDALAGTVSTTSTPAQSLTVPAGEYVYQLVLTGPTGNAVVLAYGPFTVIAKRQVSP